MIRPNDREEAARTIAEGLMVILGALDRLRLQGAAPVAPAHIEDEAIDAREAGRILGRSESYVQKHAHHPPLNAALVRSMGRGLMFSRVGIHRMLEREAGRAPEADYGLRGLNTRRRTFRTRRPTTITPGEEPTTP